MNENKFIRELKTLIYLVRESGIHDDNFEISEKDFITNNTEKIDKFYYHCHQGFYAAQDRVIYLLKKLLLEQKRLKLELKEERRKHNDKEASAIYQNIQKVKYQECVCRKLMDSIAWQLFGYDVSTMRRLYCGEPPVDITNSNLESELAFIKYFKEIQPCGFCLISDLTSFIQIGDVVALDDERHVCVSELKEGVVNEEVFNIIDNATKTQCPNYLYMALKDKDELFMHQFQRTIKQIYKSGEVSKTISTGNGKDMLTGENVRILQSDIQYNTYFDTLRSLSETCHKKGYAISTVEGCLIIGVYDTEKYPSEAFEYWKNMEGIKTPTYDIRNSFYEPLSYPVFLHGFADTFILDLISGRKTIKMSIDIEKWFQMLEQDGCNVCRLSKKETNTVNSRMKGKKSVFLIDDQGVQIKKDGKELILGDGMFSRIFTAFITPSTAKDITLSLLASSS